MSIASRVVSVVILAGIAAGGYALYQQQQVQKQAADAGRKGASKGGGLDATEGDESFEGDE